jgi:hypothetical protein
MITNYLKKVKQNYQGSSFLLPAYGRVGQGQHSLAAHFFAKRNTKNCGGEKARAGREFIFPTPLFLPATPKWRSFLLCRAKRGNQKSTSGFSSKKVRPSSRNFVSLRGKDFVQKVPPNFRIRILGDCCLAPASLGLGFHHDFIRIFEIQKQFLPAQTEVRFAEGKHKFENLSTNLFSFAKSERQSDNLIVSEFQ